MKILIIFWTFFLSLSAIGQVHVNGYYRSNGTYVAPYTRSSPNSSPYDNYSFPGNTNPYTGKTATGNPDTYIKNLYSDKSSPSVSDVWVDSYYRNDGTYVKGHWRSAPNGNPYDNFTYPDNPNPYTGKTATGNSDTYLKNNSNSYYNYETTNYVNSSILNVRSGPATDYSIITTLNYGDNVKVLESINGYWKKVKIGSTIGYVYSSYLSPSNISTSDNNYFSSPSTYSSNKSYHTSTQYVNTPTLNVRSGASTKYPVFTTLSYGDLVEIIGSVNANWIKVKVSYFNGHQFITSYGYVISDYLSLTNPILDNLSINSYNKSSNILQSSPIVNSIPNSDNNSYSVNSYYPYGYNKGKLNVWTDCSDGGKISVYIDGIYKGVITKFFYKNYLPNCDDEGVLSLILPAGTYKLRAKGSTYTWEGYINVTENQCSLKQLAK